MRTIALCLLLATALPGLALSHADADTLVARAAKAYAAGDHAAALTLFDSAHTAFSSPALLYNIGNCHFKLNDIPHAILFYERALRLAPGDADVLTNLEMARQQVVDRIDELPSFSLGATWGRIRGGKDSDQWARRSLWVCLAFFVALAIAISANDRRIRRALFGLSGVLFIGMLFTLLFAWFRYHEVSDDSEAIIMTAKVDVRSEPSDASTVLFVLHKGTKVKVLNQHNAWSEVRLANGSVGWMPPASLERI